MKIQEILNQTDKFAESIGFRPIYGYNNNHWTKLNRGAMMSIYVNTHYMINQKGIYSFSIEQQKSLISTTDFTEFCEFVTNYISNLK
jgi:hypothetical protein